MQYDEVMIRYGELSTKGKNKRIFISKLAQNVKFALQDFEVSFCFRLLFSY